MLSRFLSSATRVVASEKLAPQYRKAVSPGSVSVRGMATKVGVQLDYYMSAQFAGIACALDKGLYASHGIDQVDFLPICPVGEETRRVRQSYDDNDKSTAIIGSVEQNIFIPQLYRDPALNLKGVASIFRRSPLCLASLSNEKKNDATGGTTTTTTVGAHEDTVELIQRILANDRNVQVVASPRATKNTDLSAGTLDAIQAYTTTEVPTLERMHGVDAVHVQQLDGLNGAKLGYSQMLFCPTEVLENEEQRVLTHAFLEATFEGWALAIRDANMAATSVKEAQAMLGHLDDENNDHWWGSSTLASADPKSLSQQVDYPVEFVQRCNDHVKETYQGDKYGVIVPDRWNEATQWLLEPETTSGGGGGSGGRSIKPNFGLDTTGLWQPSSKLLAGNELGRRTLEEAKASAIEFEQTYQRKPSFVVIHVGDDPRYAHGDRRLELYSNKDHSWFKKAEVGQANGFDAEEIQLPASTTTDELLTVLYSLKDKDGIQLMRPLPDHIDARACFEAIPKAQDIDGAHYVGQTELLGNGDAVLPPVTPAGVMALLEEYSVELANKQVLVVGRSHMVGSPLTNMLREQDAIVTTVHSKTDLALIEKFAGVADVVVSCAGEKGLLKAEWISPGAIVVSVGTTFDPSQDRLVSDVDGDLTKVASQYTPVPGGVGPLSMPFLLRNAAQAAWKRMESTGVVETNWNKTSGALKRTLHFSDYNEAVKFVDTLNEMSQEMDHHANMVLKHRCVEGVDLEMEFFTYEADQVTAKDFIAAGRVDELFNDSQAAAA